MTYAYNPATGRDEYVEPVDPVEALFKQTTPTTTVEDLYKELGRPADTGGKAFWESAFGPTVDEAEKASFMKSVKDVLGKSSQAEQQVLAPTLFGGNITPNEDPNFVSPLTTKNIAGKDYTIATKDINTLKNQILGQNLTNQWTGQGFGSAEANANDMANILSSIGITDIKDFGKIKQYQGVETKYGVGLDVAQQDEDGKYYIESRVRDADGNLNLVKKYVSEKDLNPIYGFTDPDYGFQVSDQSKVKIVDGQPKIDTGQTTYGNVKTGQAVPLTYSERQTGNAWGGTFAGKGNTGYRVQFAPDGTPIFYTTGSSSNDLFNILSDNPLLNAVANVAAAYFGGPLGTAALQAAEGKDLKDIAKATALSYLGNQVAQGVTGMEGVADTFGEVGSKVIGNAAGQVVSSEGKIDPLQALISGGVSAGTNAILGEIPDFKSLDPSIQKLVTKAVSSTLTGGQGLSLQDLVNTAFKSALDTMKSGGALTKEEQAQILQNRETKRLAKIEDTVLNQPASDDGSTQGILDLIKQMYPEEVKGMSEADLAKFLEANTGDTQGADYLDTLLKSEGKPTTDEGTVNVVGNREAGSDSSATTGKTKNIGDQGNLVITGDRPKGNVTAVDNPEELVITGNRDTDYVPGIRTKDIVSSIPDSITPDDITKLFPDLNINEILQVLTPPTKTVTPSVKTVAPTKKTDPLLAVLGLGGAQQAPSQDPYAHIKSMEDLFGGDIAYKLRALGMPTNLASADIDALTKLLRG